MRALQSAERGLRGSGSFLTLQSIGRRSSLETSELAVKPLERL